MIRRLAFAAALILSAPVWTDGLHAENEAAVTLTSRVEQGKKVWSPDSITVTKGQTINLTLRNETDVVHGFSIDVLEIRREVMGGSQIEFIFTAKEAGEFRYYCHLHPAHGGGTLTVK